MDSTIPELPNYLFLLCLKNASQQPHLITSANRTAISSLIFHDNQFLQGSKPYKVVNTVLLFMFKRSIPLFSDIDYVTIYYIMVK